MANEKISEYLLEFAGSFDNVDIRLDISHNTDGIGAWVTKYTRGSTLINQLATDIATIYSKDSALSGARIVDQATFNLSFINGLVAIGNSAPGIAKLRILSGVGENPLQIDTNSSSNALVVIDDGVTGKVAFGHNSPTEGVHSTVAVRIDAKILQNLSTAQSFSDVHFAKESANALISQVTNASSNPVIAAIRTRGTIAAPSALLNGDIVGQYVYTGHNGSSLTDVAQITAISRESYSVGNHGTELQFLTTSLTAGAPSLKMVITANGNIGVGIAATNARMHIKGATDSAGDDALLIENDSGTNLVTVQNDGNVGIGAPSPSKKLHVDHNGNAANGILISNVNAGTGAYANIAFGNSESGTLASFIAQNSLLNTIYAGAGSLNIGTQVARPIGFLTGGGLRMTLSSTGEIGLGTTPVAATKLRVRGKDSLNTSFGLYVDSISGANFMAFTNLGRLGIGTSVPDSPLHVVGDSRLEGTIKQTLAVGVRGRKFDLSGLPTYFIEDYYNSGFKTDWSHAGLIKARINANGQSIIGAIEVNGTITMENSTSTYLDFDHSANDVFTHVTKYVSSDGFETRLAHNSTDRIKWSANSDNFNTQPVNFGAAAAVNSVAQVEITSTTKGFMPPVMTAIQASAITAVNGLMLYATSTDATFTSVGIWAYEGGAWSKL